MTVPRVTASASGKVILLGEHAVVYGVPAIAASLSRGARATDELAEGRQAKQHKSMPCQIIRICADLDSFMLY